MPSFPRRQLLCAIVVPSSSAGLACNMSTEEDTKSACFDTVTSALLQEAGFDPNTVLPGGFPYEKCNMKAKKDGHLPRHVPLNTFSKQVPFWLKTFWVKIVI